MEYKEYDEAINVLIKKIENKRAEFDNIYPIPRGGYYPAIRIAQFFNKPITNLPTEKTLIVDDLCDTGNTIEKYKNYQTAVVFLKPNSKVIPTFYGIHWAINEWIEFPDENNATIEENIQRILSYIGENPNREGLKGTPDRIKRMFAEIYRGYDETQRPKITTFPNGEDGLIYNNIVIDSGDFYSCCEHHMMPFFGQYWFAYIPNPKGKILGISKIGRVVDYCSARLQVQERLVHDIVTMISEALGDEFPPLGIALVMKGEHLCKTMRGVKKKGQMTSSCLIGCFKDNPTIRAEFLNLIE